MCRRLIQTLEANELACPMKCIIGKNTSYEAKKSVYGKKGNKHLAKQRINISHGKTSRRVRK